MCVPQVRVELWERQIGSAMAELQAKVESAVDQEELAQRLANIEARPSSAYLYCHIVWSCSVWD